MSSGNSRLAAVLARRAEATPEQMDQLFIVVGRYGWIGLIALVLLMSTALLWACLARVPETVLGTGILVGEQGARVLQATHESQVLEIRVKAGQYVTEGQVLACVDIPQYRLELEQAETRLKELKIEDERQLGLEKQRVEQEAAVRRRQTKVFNETIAEGAKVLEGLEEQTERILPAMRKQTEKSRQDVATLRESLTEKLPSIRRLVEQKLLPQERLVDMEARMLENSLNLANLDLRLTENDMKGVEYRQTNAQQRSRIADLRVQLHQLDTRATQLEQEIAHAQASRLVLRQEQEDRKRRTAGLLEKFKYLHSPGTGLLTELLLRPGQVLHAGGSIGTLEMEGVTPLTHLAYFPPGGGKRIQEKMLVRVTPTTVQRERYGSMVGKVKRVYPFPRTHEAAVTDLGNTDLVKGLLPEGGVIAVEIELEPADTPSGYKWTSSGSPKPVTPGTTTTTRVIVEERAPITFLLPVLRSLWEGSDS